MSTKFLRVMTESKCAYINLNSIQNVDVTIDNDIHTFIFQLHNTTIEVESEGMEATRIINILESFTIGED